MGINGRFRERAAVGGNERQVRGTSDGRTRALSAGRPHFYAHYANRIRGERPGEKEPRHADEAEPPPRRCSSPSWARLIAKVLQADPLVCRRCGGPLKVVACITDSLAIRQILDHLDLSPPEKPPLETRDVVRVPLDDEGRDIELQPA